MTMCEEASHSLTVEVTQDWLPRVLISTKNTKDRTLIYALMVQKPIRVPLAQKVRSLLFPVYMTCRASDVAQCNCESSQVYNIST